jgi:Mce-associated membrane protein
VEDQPADSGDLTTDVDSTAQRRKHRMPLRKKLAASGAERPTDADVTPETEQVALEAADQPLDQPPQRRRWFSFGRRSKVAEQQPVSEPSEESFAESVEEPQPSEPEPVVRAPVGKARRRNKAAGVATEPVTEPASDSTEVTETAELTAAVEAPEFAAAPEATETSEESAEPTVLVPHPPAGKRLLIAAAAAAVLFVGGAAFAGATLQPYLAERAEVDTKLDVARTAASAISTLWTYTPDDMETLPDRSAAFLGGDFAEEYRKYIDAIVAPNKQAQVTNTTQVMGAAVETLTPTEATAIVYTNSVATSPVTKNIPSLRYLAYRLTMQREDTKWLITRMSTVTSFDLTPQL